MISDEGYGSGKVESGTFIVFFQSPRKTFSSSSLPIIVRTICSFIFSLRRTKTWLALSKSSRSGVCFADDDEAGSGGVADEPLELFFERFFAAASISDICCTNFFREFRAFSVAVFC